MHFDHILDIDTAALALVSDVGVGLRHLEVECIHKSRGGVGHLCVTTRDVRQEGGGLRRGGGASPGGGDGGHPSHSASTPLGLKSMDHG